MHSINTDERRLMVYADEAPNTYILRRPTGIIELDIHLAGGFPAGGCSIVSGEDNCLSGETLINHQVREFDGKKITDEWITLERLYQRFHGIKTPGRGKNKKKSKTAKTGVYTAPSMNDQGGIIQNRILDVVCTGDKECFEVITARGHRIVGTAEHRFFDGARYITLGSLRPNDRVYIHNNTRKEAPTDKPGKPSPRMKDPERDNYFRFIAIEDRVAAVRHVGRRTTYDLKMAAPSHNYVANNFVVHNSGKTWLVLRTMAMQQRLHGDACRLAFALAEGTFPFDQAINAGLKIPVPDEMLEQWQRWRSERGLAPYSNEQLLFFKQKVGEFFILRGATGEEILQVVLDCVRTKAFHVIACDSMNGLLPSDDAWKNLDDPQKQAAHASLITNFFRHYIPITTGIDGTNETTMIFTQQVRANRSRSTAPAAMQQYLKPWAIAGGYAARHFKLIDLVLWDGKTLKRGEGETRETIGKMINWETEKGKAGTHDHLTGEMAYYYALGGVDAVGELIASGIKRGVIQQRGSRYVVCRPDTGEPIEELSAPSQKAMRKMLEADFDYELCLRKEILTAAGVQCLFR